MTVNGFGPALKRLRLAAGLTQEALAERAGISPRAVSDLERDPHRTPRLDTVTLLADALALPAGQRAELLAAARPSAPTPAGAVPRPLTPLIGRAGVVADLCELLGSGETRLLTLTGPGGVGKTRLALEVLATVADRYANGAVFVDLAPLRDHTLVITAIGQRFGLDERDAVPMPERLAVVLRDKRVLMLLDNVEHLVDARTELLALLTACPGVTALVTGRVPLRVRGEREFRIAPLEVPAPGTSDSPAAELFAERARAVGVDLVPGDAPAVAEICRRLEGLPLAIELAAARVRLLPPDALLVRLERRLPMLTGGPHDLADRQQTMRDAIAWSHQLLSEPAGALFRALSIFAGGAPLAAVEAVTTASSTLDTLAELVDASLIVVQQGPRIGMLETIREYGLELLQAAGETDALARKHIAYFVGLAAGGGPSLELEQDNLRAALSRALEHRDGEAALRLCGALWRFWIERGHLGEGLRYTRAALALPDAGDTETRIAALTGAARMAIGQSRYDEAGTWCEQLVDLARRAEIGLVTALTTRGLLARLRDQYADAVKDHEEAVALAEASADHAGLATALISLSYDAFLTGETEQAAELGERGLAETRAAGSSRDLADALALLAWQAMHAGRHARVHDLGTEAVALYRALKDTGKEAEGLRILGTNAQLSGEYDTATELFRACHRLFRERGTEYLADQMLSHLGHTALCTGDLGLARELGEASLASARRYADLWGVAMSATQLGHVELAAGRIDRARALFLESADDFQAIGNPLYVSWCLEGLAGVAVADRRLQLAAELCAARDGVLVRISAVLPPMYPPGYRQTLSTVDTELRAGRNAVARQRPLEELLREFDTQAREFDTQATEFDVRAPAGTSSDRPKS